MGPQGRSARQPRKTWPHLHGRSWHRPPAARDTDRAQLDDHVFARPARAWPQGRIAREQRPATGSTVSMRKPKKITPEAIAAFRRAISDAGTDADEVALHAALGLRPWHATVFD